MDAFLDLISARLSQQCTPGTAGLDRRDVHEGLCGCEARTRLCTPGGRVQCCAIYPSKVSSFRGAMPVR